MCILSGSKAERLEKLGIHRHVAMSGCAEFARSLGLDAAIALIADFFQ